MRGETAVIWERLLEFLAMGGFALYVWGSYAAALAVVLIEIVLLILRKRAILGHLGWTGTVPSAPDGAKLTCRRRSDREGVIETELPVETELP